MSNGKKAKRRTRPPFVVILIGVFTYLALLAMLFAVVAPDQYDLRAGQVSPITITASKDVEDTVATQTLVNDAIAAVPVSYTLDESVQPAVLEAISDTFDAMENYRVKEQAHEEHALKELQAVLPALALTEEDARLIGGFDEETFARMREDMLATADELLASRIAEGGEAEALAKMERDLENGEYSEKTIDLLSRVGASCLKANMLIDEETTEQNRQKAAESIEPVVYLKGRNIVRSGEIITKAQIAMLESLGMLKGNPTGDVLMYIGVALLVLLVLAMVAVYMITYEKEILYDARQMGLLCVILLITCGICMLVQNINQFLVPVALGVMLTTLLLKSRLALILNIALAVLSGLMNSGVSGSFSTSLIVDYQNRSIYFRLNYS